MKTTAALSFGANLGFSHMHCVTCGEERLHRYCCCVSCKTPNAQGKYKPLPWHYHGGRNARAKAKEIA